MEVKINSLIKKVSPQFTLQVDSAIFQSGKVIGLVGHNGKGKTTLLNILAGLDNEFTGEILYDGKKISPLLRKQITMTFQTPALLNRSVYANIEYPLKIRKLDSSKRKEVISDMLSKLNIEHLSKKNATKLSGGESQRAALARGLSFSPRLLLLDEPFSAIDEKSIHNMEQCILDYNKATGATVVLVSHNSQQIENMCNSIITL